ncbi:MAG: hypothetical protein F6K30_23425 [Cyanothece sp. SIO2G6]|nr:hypothetical protein [Cyanothece sp. SIO2G6]
MEWINYKPIIEQMIGFWLIFLVAGRITQSLLRRLVYAADPEATPKRFHVPSRPARIAVAIADIIAWCFSFTVACVVMDLPQAAQVALTLFNLVFTSWPLILFTLLITYSFSKRGNELLLSLLGGWYLNYHRQLLEQQQTFDLGHDQVGRISDIALLHTTFSLNNGGTAVRPNAYLMHQFFGFAQELGDEWPFLQKLMAQPQNRHSSGTD